MTENLYPNFTDKPAVDDEFEILNNIQGLSEFLMSCQSPTTISIKGEWGSGKTSIMKQLTKEIEQNNKTLKKGNRVLNIWFDTWQFSQFSYDEQLPIILLSRLVSKISKDGGIPDNENKNALQSILKNVLSSAGDVTNDIIRHKSGFDISRFLKKDEIDIFQEIEDIKIKFKDLIQEVDYERIVIYIDDLDRLAPKRAVELLETLKIFLDVEKCIFVLAIDYDVVIRGISDKYGFDMSDPEELEKGKNFFDKIIQVPYSVPVDEYKFKEFLRKYVVRENLENASFTIEDLEFLLIHSVGKNPRSIKRVLNTFKLQTLITKYKINEDKNLILFGFICMEQAYPYLYASFIDKFRENYDDYSANENSVEKIMDAIREEEKDANLSNLTEELKKPGNNKFLAKLGEVVKGIEVQTLAEIINSSISTSTSKIEKVEIKSKWDLFYSFEHFFNNHVNKNHSSVDRSEVEKIYHIIGQMFNQSNQELNIEYKSDPNGNRSTISFKRGKSTGILLLHLDKESFTVEFQLGKKLKENPEIQAILKQYNLKLTSKNNLNLNKKDSEILVDDGTMEGFRSIVEIILLNK